MPPGELLLEPLPELTAWASGQERNRLLERVRDRLSATAHVLLLSAFPFLMPPVTLFTSLCAHTWQPFKYLYEEDEHFSPDVPNIVAAIDYLFITSSQSFSQSLVRRKPCHKAFGRLTGMSIVSHHSSESAPSGEKKTALLMLSTVAPRLSLPQAGHRPV